MTNRDRQALESKERIFNAAIDLIREKGYDNVTIEDICNKTGMSVGAFYHYFKSKSEIVAHSQLFYNEALEKVLKESQELSAKQTFENVIAAIVKHVTIDGLELCRERSKQLVSGRFFSDSVDFHGILYNLIIDKALENDEFIPGLDDRVSLIGYLSTNVTGWFACWCVAGDALSFADIVLPQSQFLIKTLFKD